MFFQSHRALPCEIACYSGPQSIFCNICIRMAFKSLKLFLNFNEKETSKDQFQFRYKIDTRGQTITRGAKSQLLQVQLSKICKKYVREKTRRKFILPILFPFPNLKLFLSFMQKRIYVFFLTHSFSPVCVLICPSSSQALEKAFPQYWHTQGRSCCLMWLFRSVSEVV